MVKLYRELKSKSIWQLSSPEQKVVLITILLLANHEENKWEWKDNQYVCKPGQLITSLNSLVRECGQGVTIQNVRTALERFEKFPDQHFHEDRAPYYDRKLGEVPGEGNRAC